MTATNSFEIFKELCDLADSELDDRLPERIQQLQEQGIEIKVETNLEEPEFITDPNPYTEVVQNCELWIGQSKVYEWQETYWGSFGGMDAGWWIEQGDTSIDFDVRSLLELLDLLPEAPEVPKPDVSGDDD
ncbi:MAG: hypothetical protein EBT56_16170 [Betaproteobacteria bacterium]|nr:hypothetical protein [Betaproteobacteria bacterium]